MKKSKILALSIIILLLLLGLGLMLYPMFSAWYNEHHRSELHTDYMEQIQSIDNSQLDAIRAAADQHNRSLAAGDLDRLKPEENGYFTQLVIPGGSQVMGYIKIPKIRVMLPIVHGCDAQALQTACGHMPQSSLPVGGSGTHAVLSAHTGMASSPMFSDLPQLRPGDVFQLEILGEVLTYQIQSDADIATVLPADVQSLNIRPDEDLCTLITCVPFGVNTHRLLVTGHRIPTPTPEESLPQATADTGDQGNGSIWLQNYIAAIKISVLVVGVIILAVVVILTVRKKRRKKKC